MKKVYLKKRKINEDGSMSTTMSVPGMGNPTPAINNIGSGDLWGNIIKKKKRKKFIAESYNEFLRLKK